MWPTYDELTYAGINTPRPSLVWGREKRRQKHFHSIILTPDLIVGKTRPSTNSSARVFLQGGTHCLQAEGPTRDRDRVATLLGYGAPAGDHDRVATLLGHGNELAHTGDLIVVIHHPTLRGDPNIWR
ncbi:hypothetical protein GW17_00061559 [Ensete ventricosum]|nr:hypothetical protein GW17_00061559 [Ensete ventricosum]